MDQSDIEVTTIQITDSFRYGGRTYDGLKDLRKCSISGSNGNIGMPPFVVRVEKSYPCFDSSDSLYEDRYYQTFFLTMDETKASRICEETTYEHRRYCRDNGIEEVFQVMEPRFSMHRIEEIHLPFIYYHGDGDTMEIVQNKNAKVKVEIVKPSYRFSWNNPEPPPCLYGPPPTFIDNDILDL